MTIHTLCRCHWDRTVDVMILFPCWERWIFYRFSRMHILFTIKCTLLCFCFCFSSSYVVSFSGLSNFFSIAPSVFSNVKSEHLSFQGVTHCPSSQTVYQWDLLWVVLTGGYRGGVGCYKAATENIYHISIHWDSRGWGYGHFIF